MLNRLAVLLPLLAAAGCAGDGKVAIHPVSGQVLYNGKAAAGVKIYLIPTSAPMIPEVPNNPYGITDAEGRFKLSTYGGGDGAAEGGYQVMLLWPDESTTDEVKPDRLMGWYDGARSQESAQIKAG